jgi:hypothetical protein
MCFFLYSVCDKCRFPSTARTTLVQECSPFLEVMKAAHGKALPEHTRLLKEQSGNWQLHGLHTISAQQVDKSSGTDYDVTRQILPRRNCVRWTPDPTLWTCKHCRDLHEAHAPQTQQRPKVKDPFIHEGVPAEVSKSVPHANTEHESRREDEPSRSPRPAQRLGRTQTSRLRSVKQSFNNLKLFRRKSN